MTFYDLVLLALFAVFALVAAAFLLVLFVVSAADRRRARLEAKAAKQRHPSSK